VVGGGKCRRECDPEDTRNRLTTQSAAPNHKPQTPNLSGAFVKSDPNEDDTLSIMPLPAAEGCSGTGLCLSMVSLLLSGAAPAENMEEKGEPILDMTELGERRRETQGCRGGGGGWHTQQKT
jgi:hypothetical protein